MSIWPIQKILSPASHAKEQNIYRLTTGDQFKTFDTQFLIVSC